MENKIAKPFLKWAGGKTQLLAEIATLLPHQLKKSKFTYIEPFVGSGAVLFWMLNNFPNMERAIVCDINEDLINTYRTIALSPEALINILEMLQKEYHSFEDQEENKKLYFYEKRDLYNTRSTDVITQSALFIFLNRTCFNGLYRVNRNNRYNVPIGSYKKPTICDADNILAVSKILKKVEIISGDYDKTIGFADTGTLYYFDPPYKPLSDTSNFNSYSINEFDDQEQVRLKDFCIKLDSLGCQWILSNSDVKCNTKDCNFFDDLYYNYFIHRVKAKRSINSISCKRGELNELLITNYHTIDYIPALKFNKEDLFVKNFDKPYWTPKEKILIESIKIDKTLMSYDNPISNSTLNDIISNFDIMSWIPITVNKDLFLLDGQHRLEAAKKMKLKYIDVIIQDTELLETSAIKTKCKI